MSYTTIWKERGIIWSYSGVLTGAELIASNVEIYSDPRFDDLEYQIVDLRRVAEFRILQHHMKAVADLDALAAKQNPNIRVAVVTKEPTGHSITRTYLEEAPEVHWETRVFKDYVEAKAWAMRGGGSTHSRT